MNKTTLFLAAALLYALSNTAQVKDTTEGVERAFQISLVTPIGTNGIDAYKITNKVSINIFAGIANGVNGCEFGGFANVTRRNMKGVQGAGFTNVVLRNVKGAQFAGYVNYSGGTLNGAQFAGFCNVNRKQAKGAQFAGFANVNLDSLKGAQFAGFCNYNRKDMTGLQAAGYTNVNTGNLKGAQLSGFANVCTGNVEGLQASGFFNYAKKVKGAQLGFINIADSVNGATIGFLNIVKNGLHQVEVSADELFYANASVRTGTHKFYNVFTAGMSPKGGDLLWNIGYGLGTSLKINDKLRSDITVSAQHVSNGLFYFATSELYKVYIGAEYKLANKCYIAAGPTFNLYFGDTVLKDFGSTYSKVPPYSFLNETNSNGFNFKAWVGAKVAIRFL